MDATEDETYLQELPPAPAGEDGAPGLAIFNVVCRNPECGNSGYLLQVYAEASNPSIICGGAVTSARGVESSCNMPITDVTHVT